MHTCPYCQSSISEEIQQFGGECSNCFRFIEGNFNEQEEFEPTGMFTREQLSSFLEEQNISHEVNKEETDDVNLDELEIEDIEFDDVTELLEPTDPIVEEYEVTPAKPVEVDEVGADDFDFDDEPTVALTEEQLIADEYLESDELGIVENNPFESVDQQAPSLDIIESNKERIMVEDAPVAHGSDYVFDEDSEESFLGDDEPQEDLEGPIDIPLVISPKDEREVKNRGAEPKNQSSKSMIGPVLFGVALVGTVFAVMLPKEETTIDEVEIEQQNLFVPEVATGSIAEPEEEVEVKQTSKSTKTVQVQKKNEPEIVERGGVRTFKTAAPVSRTPSAGTIGGQTSGSVQNDLPNLQKALEYCHTTALKTDPTASGKWEVSFTVTGQGKATGVLIKPLRKKHTQIESCMKKKVQIFNFHNDGGSTPVKFRVVFGG